MSDLPETKAGVEFKECWLDLAEFEDRGFSSLLGGKPIYTEETQLAEAEFTAKLEAWLKRRRPEDTVNEAYVRLFFAVGPKVQPTYQARVAYVGRFQAALDATIEFESFTSHFAIAYLVPFLRSKIAQLTAESRFPRYLLPPLDV